MFAKLLLPILFTSAMFLGGCSKPPSNKEAVQQGLMEYLKSRAGINVDTMDVTVTSVTFRGDEADATVTFSPKGSKDHAGAMNMKYVMENKGGKWVVKGRSGSSEHGGEAAAPQGSPTMPPGHPPTAKEPDGARK